MADLSLAPGQPYVEVEYNYEYKSKDRLISIRPGDCFLLVKKTNEDWWQVRRPDGSKAFYVPAQYVREVRKALMPPGRAPSGEGHAPSSHHGHVATGNTDTEQTHGHAPFPYVSTEHSAHGHAPSAHGHAPSAHGHAPSAHGHAPSAHGPAPSAHGHAPSAHGHAPSAHGHAPSAHGHTHSGPSTGPVSGGLWVKPLEPLENRTVSRGESTLRRSGQREVSPLHSPSGGPLSGSVGPLSGSAGSLSGPLPGPLSAAPLSGSSDSDRGLGVPPLNHSNSSSTLPRSRGRSPELQRQPLDVDVHEDQSGEEQRGQGRGKGRSLGSESDLSSSSTEQLESISDLKRSGPPFPSGPPLSILGNWETHREAGGRLFYVNQSSKERTWKPPRARDQPGGEWVRVGDDHSRPLNSNENSRSEWELSKSNHLIQDGTKTRSLDRRSAEHNVLNKWRHSTHIPEVDKEAATPSEKCGLLNMTKITENGKKVRKNWTSSLAVLQGSTLHFTKGQTGGSSWFGGQSKPELTVDLRGSSVDWAPKDRSSKKHVLELKTRQGTELLIQSENEAVVQDWLRILQDCISTHACESDEGMDDEPESPGRETNGKEKEQRELRKDRVEKSGSSLDVSEHKKRHKLRKFLTRRPTLQSVKDKGYIKDQVFGCSLSSLCQRENTTVPHFVTMCIEHVESSGLSVDGLYRVSGNLAVIQKLRFAVNHDESVSLSHGKWEDIHVTTGALKMFFRELPEPLFTYALFYDFINAIKSPDYKQRVQSIRDLIHQLPRANQDTMGALFRHLRRVIDHGDDNRMTIQSVAIVFGPTLLRPETDTWNMAVHMVYQNQIVELILIECSSIFGL
ncbi:unnamed protein product [Knipowitschia caucasica]|uniref:Rho GTPase-activating protein 12-like n=1 Tax=Knipowitschia caucasica TaxID=637954 RepID=A0AAV2JX66_KNICA